jgi:DinB family protein
MGDINTVLAGSRNAVEELIAAGENGAPAWNTPRAAGKWAPSQVVEHVARVLEQSANVADGRPSQFTKLPALIHPLLRSLLFTRVLRTAHFPKGKTNNAMNPASGPATPAAGRTRLQAAHQEFEDACRRLASQGGRMNTTIFGAVAVEDYVRFMELHTRHHRGQMSDRQ